VYKLITILADAIPIILFLRTIFFGRSKAMKLALFDFRKQIDYDDLGRYRLRNRLLGWKTDLLPLELTPGPFFRTPRAHSSCCRPGLLVLPSVAPSSCSYRPDVALEAAEPTCARLAWIPGGQALSSSAC
jgi:hypothetical protein